MPGSGGDLDRRIATVALDPPTVGHHLRTDFKIKNLHNWMETHRGEYLAALLTVARGWVNAGRPSKQIRSDDFALWIESVRGLMEWAGFKGQFGHGADLVAMTEEDEEWETFSPPSTATSKPASGLSRNWWGHWRAPARTGTR